MNVPPLNIPAVKKYQVIDINIIKKFVLVLFLDFLLIYGLYTILSYNIFISVFILMRIIAIIVIVTSLIILCYALKSLSKREICLCIGFISISVLECINTYFCIREGFNLYKGSFCEWLCFASRLAAAVSIFFSIRYTYEKFMLKKMLTVAVLAISVLGIIFSLTVSYTGLKQLLEDKAVYLESFIKNLGLVGISCCGIYVLLYGYKMDRVNRASENSMFFAVLFTVPADLLHAIPVKGSVFLHTLSYSLVLLSYVFLAKTTAISLLELPYLELINSQERIKTIFDDLPLGLAVYDEDRVLRFINKTGANILEIQRPDDYISRDAGFDKENNKDPFYEDIIKISETDIKFLSNIVRFVRKNRESMIIATRVSKIKNSILVVFENLKSDYEDPRLRFHSQLILDSIVDMVFVIDNEYKIVLYNGAAKRIFENFSNAYDNEDIRNLSSKADWDISDILSGIFVKRQLNIETSFKTKENHRAYLMVYTAPILNNSGKVVGAIVMASDITEYKKRQEAQIQQEKLALLGQMGAGIVHATKNFLATIKGSSQILKLIASDAEILKYASKIDQASNEVNRIITEFLNMANPSRPEAKVMSVGDLMAKALHMLETIIKVNLVTLELDCRFQDEQICCDEGQIKQVILNIVKNAIEAMHDIDDPRIKISTGLRGYGYIYISITDNGPGIPTSLLVKVGTPFFTTKESGTGLGINVSNKIIREHGGVLEIKSVENEGTTFCILLPRV